MTKCLVEFPLLPLIFFGSSSDVQWINSDYNLFTAELSVEVSNTSLTLAQWRTQTGQDTNSQSNQTLIRGTQIWKHPTSLSNPAADYHLIPTSQAIGTGINLDGINFDQVGVIRPANGKAPCLGALEYTAGNQSVAWK